MSSLASKQSQNPDVPTNRVNPNANTPAIMRRVPFYITLVVGALAVILLAISKLFRHIAGFVVILIIALLVYIYVSCWPMASTSAFCSAVTALPFLH